MGFLESSSARGDALGRGGVRGRDARPRLPRSQSWARGSRTCVRRRSPPSTLLETSTPPASPCGEPPPPPTPNACGLLAWGKNRPAFATECRRVATALHVPHGAVLPALVTPSGAGPLGCENLYGLTPRPCGGTYTASGPRPTTSTTWLGSVPGAARQARPAKPDSAARSLAPRESAGVAAGDRRRAHRRVKWPTASRWRLPTRPPAPPIRRSSARNCRPGCTRHWLSWTSRRADLVALHESCDLPLSTWQSWSTRIAKP